MSRRAKGEGTVYPVYQKDKDNNIILDKNGNPIIHHWVAQYIVGKKENGNADKKSRYGKTKHEALKKLNELKLQVATNHYTPKTKITLIELVGLSIEETFNSNRIKETTYNRNLQTKRIIEQMPIANMPVQQIIRSDINSSLNTLVNYSNSTIDKAYSLIRRAYNYAMLNEYITKDLFAIKGSIIKPVSKKLTKQITALEVDEQASLLKELEISNDKYKDIIYIALYTGARVGEILALKRCDINLKSKTISINKTLTKDKYDNVILGSTTKTYSGMRVIPILKSLMPILKKYSHYRGFLFKENNKFIRPSTINSHFKRVCKHANIKLKIYPIKRNHKTIHRRTSSVNTHMLRHTFATRCIESGMNPAVLQRILGHKNIQITLNTYTSIFDKYKKKEIEKIEMYFNKK